MYLEWPFPHLTQGCLNAASLPALWKQPPSPFPALPLSPYSNFVHASLDIMLKKIFFFFDVDHFKSLYWISYNSVSFYILFFWPWGRHVSSLTGDQTCTSCIGRQNPNYQTTREVPALVYWQPIPPPSTSLKRPTLCCSFSVPRLVAGMQLVPTKYTYEMNRSFCKYE